MRYRQNDQRVENRHERKEVVRQSVRRPPPADRKDESGEWTVLMVAEKNSIAKTIAEALCDNHGMTQRRGRCKYCPVYEFTSRILKRRGKFRVTSVAGHIFSTDFPPQAANWE